MIQVAAVSGYEDWWIGSGVQWRSPCDLCVIFSLSVYIGPLLKLAMSNFLRASVLGSAREVRPHPTPRPVPPHLLPSRHLLDALSIVSAGVSISTRTAVLHNAILSHSTPGRKSRKVMARQRCMCRYIEADGSPGMQMFSMYISTSNRIPQSLQRPAQGCRLQGRG